MSSFTEPLRVYPAAYNLRPNSWHDLLPPFARKTRWVIGRDLTYYVGSEENPIDVIRVPAGFLFDGASVPWPATLIAPKSHPIYMAAAAVHDWLYVNTDWQGSRSQADAIFYESMLVLGAPKLWAWFMWLAVVAGGWVAWYRRRLFKTDRPSDHIVSLDGFLSREEMV